MVFHCLFEQSGVFKNEFIKLGFTAYDYDILNDFNETDFIVDLFSEIGNAFDGKVSLFDSFSDNDFVFAFFPCTRFSNQSYMLFQCSQKQLCNLSDLEKLYKVIDYHKELSFLYDIFCKLYILSIKKNFKLIIENPYSQEHYLTRYFPIKPKFVDFDRTFRGDSFKKPTQFWFVNCEPKFNFILEPFIVSDFKTIVKTGNKVKRSLINGFYANRFIREFIL